MTISPEGAKETMPHTTTNLLVHFIFSTKQRCALIKSDFEEDLHAYLGALFVKSAAPLSVLTELKITYIFLSGCLPITPSPTWPV
jgi:hypothetical protein